MVPSNEPRGVPLRCGCCGSLVWVCEECRWRRYCGGDCRREGRRRNQRAANRRYRQTRWGKRTRARLQAEYRQRRRRKIVGEQYLPEEVESGDDSTGAGAIGMEPMPAREDEYCHESWTMVCAAAAATDDDRTAGVSARERAAEGVAAAPAEAPEGAGDGAGGPRAVAGWSAARCCVCGQHLRVFRAFGPGAARAVGRRPGEPAAPRLRGGSGEARVSCLDLAERADVGSRSDGG